MNLKKILPYILFVIICLILLDFIPIKKAVKISDPNMRNLIHKKGDRLYICEYAAVTDSSWHVIGDEKGIRKILKSGGLYLKDPLQGYDPRNHINRKDFPWDYPYNKYILIGSQGKGYDEAGDFTYEFKVDDWYIVAPIVRNSIRDLYAPKNYLTVYDYIKFPW